jgi:LacI family transcriptional regulator
MRKQDEQIPGVPTLQDVAKAAGVSTATVSRCLNAPSVVSEKTRVRVMEAVKTLGYAPNFSAQALAAKRTNTFGAIVPTMANAIFARGLQAFQEELQKSNITMLVASSSYRPELEEEQIRALVARGADALLLIGHDRSDDIYKFLERRGIPYVVAWVHDDGQSHVSIGFDNKLAMQSLTRAVLDLGHRRLGYITAQRIGNDRAQARYGGLSDALSESGLSIDDVALEETDYSIKSGADAFDRILKRQPDTTVVMCGNDVLAAGALQKARSLGLRVPKDISITGFDDIDIAEIVSPALTTIHVPHRNMGRGAASMLIEMSRDGTRPKSRELPAHIEWRGTLGPSPDQM